MAYKFLTKGLLKEQVDTYVSTRLNDFLKNTSKTTLKQNLILCNWIKLPKM